MQPHELIATQVKHDVRLAVRVSEFDFEDIGAEHLDDAAHSPAAQASIRQVVGQRDNIQQLDGSKSYVNRR